MTLREAAEWLATQLKGEPWFTSVAIGKDEIIVYTKKKMPPHVVPVEANGYPVRWAKMGKIRLFTA